MVAKGVGPWALLTGRGWGGRQLIFAPRPVSQAVILCGFKGMWPFGSFCFHGSEAEITEVKMRSALVMVHRPEALFLREFDTDQSLMSCGLMSKAVGVRHVQRWKDLVERKLVSQSY